MPETILDWPDWAERTSPENRSSASKFDHGFQKTKRDLRNLLEDKLEVEKWYIEDVTGSNGDPGVIVRWTVDGTDHAIACDEYTTKGGNLREAYLWLKYNRRQGRRPVETGRDQFAAAQLPGGDGDALVVAGESAYDILGVSPDASEAEVRSAFRDRAKETHPDTEGGSEEEFKKVKRARRTIIKGE